MVKEKESLGKLRKDIAVLKNQLGKINKEKEDWFKEKEELNKQISQFIQKIKTLKNEKDSFNVVYRELKKKRDEFNKKVKDYISEIKILRKERKKISKETGISLNSESIKNKIKKLEETIETEILSLKKEEKYMAEIKSLKKSLKENKVVEEVDNKIKVISKNIDDAKEKAQEYHKKLREHLKKNKKSGSYKDFISLSKQIEFLKKSQKKAFGMFIDFKNKFVSLNKLLKNKLFEERKIKDSITKKRTEFDEEKKKKEEKLLDEKFKEIENKLRTKKKLTTEDLLGR